jgi:hypothetical protein
LIPNHLRSQDLFSPTLTDTNTNTNISKRTTNNKKSWRADYLRFQAQYLRRLRVPRWQNVSVALRKQLIEAGSTRDVAARNDAAAALYKLTPDEMEALSAVTGVLMPLDLTDHENKAKEAVKAFWGNRAAAVAKQKELGREDHHRSHGRRSAEEERSCWRHASGRWRHGRHGLLTVQSTTIRKARQRRRAFLH